MKSPPIESLLKEASIPHDTPVIEKKASSTSSLYIGSTITTPNVKSILRTIAAFLAPKISSDREYMSAMLEHPDFSYFCEDKYIIENPESGAPFTILPPTKENIAEFIGALYDSAQFSPECCIVCIIYITRILSEIKGITLHASNWRPLVLIGILIAQKVWDDRYLSNGDFAFIYPFFSKSEINILEQKFLQLIQYQVTVKASGYMNFYYDLRAFDKANTVFL